MTPVRGSRALSARIPQALVVLGLLGTIVALFDPAHLALGAAGAMLGAIGLLLAYHRGSLGAAIALPLLLAGCCLAGALIRPDFGADSPSHYVYLRSAYFDHDLDFANEWEQMGFPARKPTATHHQPNLHPIGPALLWSPFFVLADGYVLLDRALEGPRLSRDGNSLPYKRSTALGTFAFVLLGAWALLRYQERHTSSRVALLSVAGVILASPIAYYTLVMPAMAHGIAFGLAAILLWACDRVRRLPSAMGWILVGAVLGLLALTRWQAAVCGLLPAAVALEALRRRNVRLVWLVGAALAAGLAFLPQMVAWKILFGRLLTMPQGSGFFDWRSPHLLDTLLSADHGLFAWTPLMIPAVLGLVWGWRRDALVHLAGLAILGVTAWVNGGVTTWAGSDAFGARRFDLWIPFAALGLAVAIEATALVARRSPLLVPGLVIAGLALWNTGFIVSFRALRFPHAAPLERVAGDQGRNLQRAAQALLGWVAGPPGRALAYKYFAGEYVFENTTWRGTFDLASLEEDDLSGAWSPPRRKPGETAFRWAMEPESCVRVPLEAAMELPVSVTVRAPGGAQPQQMSVFWNEHPVGVSPVGIEWGDARFVLPRDAGVAGENWLCLRFAKTLPKEEEDRGLSAAVAQIQLR